MGFYVNPSSDGFQSVLNTGLYVDKTGLISYINSVLETERKLTCFSRPRRFGKSFAAKMLVAYYSKGANAGNLFEDLCISKNEDFKKHLNQYDVIYLDILWFIVNAESIQDTILELQKDVIEELRDIYPKCIRDDTRSLPKALAQINSKTGNKFFVVIDEWDALFREAKEEFKIQEDYIKLLRGLFKGMQIAQFIVGAYMTGILPIKKYGTQSALTDFKEFTMINPGPLSRYVGFTEKEAVSLCEKYYLDFDEAKKWYDGYWFETVGHVYSPNSIIEAIVAGKFSNYWTQTETYESLKIYIEMDFDGLKTAIIEMLGGQHCKIDPGTFQNDMISLKSKDDVFTLLVHLGYLAYNEEKKEVFIPNEEVREEFIRAVKNGNRPELVKAIQTYECLIENMKDSLGYNNDYYS